MKKLLVMFSSLGLLVMGGILLMADSAEPGTSCTGGTYDLDSQYTFELSCTHDDETFTYEGTTSIHIKGEDDKKMQSDVDNLSFLPISFTDNDWSCEDRKDQTRHIQTIFYHLDINDDARNVHAELECSPLRVREKDKLELTEQTGTCISKKEDPLAPNCQIKLLPK